MQVLYLEYQWEPHRSIVNKSIKVIELCKVQQQLKKSSGLEIYMGA